MPNTTASHRDPFDLDVSVTTDPANGDDTPCTTDDGCDPTCDSSCNSSV